MSDNKLYYLSIALVAVIIVLSRLVDLPCAAFFWDLGINPVFIYLLVLAAIAALVILSVKYIPGIVRFLYKLIKFTTWKNFKTDPRVSQLSEEQKKHLAIGALYAEQHLMYSDSLRTGVWKGMTRIILKESWDAGSREEALKALDNLTKMTHSSYYVSIMNLYYNEEEETWMDRIKESYPDDDKWVTVAGFFNNFFETKDILIEEDAFTEEDFLRGIAAWDLGRLVGMCRFCRDLNYISDLETLEKIRYAYGESRKIFASWEEFRRSYLLGRAVWGGAGGNYHGFKVILRSLTEENNSPWNLIHFT